MSDDERFEPKPGSVKLWCKICGRSGYAGGRWMDACRQPHDYACEHCDARYPSKMARAAHMRHGHHRYRCNQCGHIVRRDSTKKWIASYCESTGKNTRIYLLLEEPS